MGNSMKKAVFPLIAGLILAVVAVVSGTTGAEQTAALDAQKAELREVNSQIDEAHKREESLQSAASMELSGASAERVVTDSRVIEELAERVLTWDSHASYEAARESAMRAYGLSEDAPFMQSFLPAAPVNRDSQGNEYAYIDAAKLNSRVTSTTVKLLSVNELKYTYLALVDVQSKSSDGLGTASNVATIFVMIDAGGTVDDLSGFASTTPPQSTR